MKHKNKKYKFTTKKVASRSVRRPIDPTIAEQEEALEIQAGLDRTPNGEDYYSVFEDELAEMELHAPSDFLPEE